LCVTADIRVLCVDVDQIDRIFFLSAFSFVFPTTSIFSSIPADSLLSREYFIKQVILSYNVFLEVLFCVIDFTTSRVA